MFIGPACYEFPWSTYHAELVAWYDWQFKGIENGYSDLPPVRYWLHGAERWQESTDWPLPDSEVRRLYLDIGIAKEGAPANALGAQTSNPTRSRDGMKVTDTYLDAQGPVAPTSSCVAGSARASPITTRSR